MKVVVFSTDKNILDPHSAVSKRQQAYAKCFESYTVLLPDPFLLLGFDPVPFFKGSFKSFSRWRDGSYTLFVWSADVLSAQDPFEIGFIAWIFSLKFRIKKPFLISTPIHIQVHTDFFAPGFMHTSFLNRIRHFIAPFVLRRANRIRVVSESIKESIEKRVAPKVPITVLPIFVDTKHFQDVPRMKHPQFKIALLFVGRLEREKNAGLAIEALKAARDRGHDAGLTIVGSGSEEEKLKSRTRALGLERFVVFTGANDPKEFYASADVVLVPSLYEGYGMVIVEALSVGVPVIATDVGIAREAGAIVTTEKDFADTLIRWIASGPRQAVLVNYPYQNFDEYVQKYCGDIQNTAY